MCNLSSLSFSVVVITLLYEEKICHLNMLVCVAQKKKMLVCVYITMQTQNAVRLGHTVVKYTLL